MVTTGILFSRPWRDWSCFFPFSALAPLRAGLLSFAPAGLDFARKGEADLRAEPRSDKRIPAVPTIDARKRVGAKRQNT
jgi:hypothetical protein